MKTFQVVQMGDDALVTCDRCGHGHVVVLQVWAAPGPKWSGSTRPCPYCFYTSKVPDSVLVDPKSRTL